MNNAIFYELRFFGASILWGIILLILYDFLRIFRRIVKHNSIIVGMQDIIYWVISSILIFRMMYQQNDGVIRGFSILAMLLGMILYHNLISDKLVKIIADSINGIFSFIGKILYFILRPFIFLFKKILKILSWFLDKLKKLFNYLIKILKKIFKSSKITVSEEEKGD
jgi:spore cortex biosynthesis protein YabQ